MDESLKMVIYKEHLADEQDSSFFRLRDQYVSGHQVIADVINVGTHGSRLAMEISVPSRTEIRGTENLQAPGFKDLDADGCTGEPGPEEIISSIPVEP